MQIQASPGTKDRMHRLAFLAQMVRSCLMSCQSCWRRIFGAHLSANPRVHGIASGLRAGRKCNSRGGAPRYRRVRLSSQNFMLTFTAMSLFAASLCTAEANPARRRVGMRRLPIDGCAMHAMTRFDCTRRIYSLACMCVVSILFSHRRGPTLKLLEPLHPSGHASWSRYQRRAPSPRGRTPRIGRSCSMPGVCACATTRAIVGRLLLPVTSTATNLAALMSG